MNNEDLDKIADFYNEEDFDNILLYYSFNFFENLRKGDIFLELGCSIGISTKFLLKYASAITVVEGSLKNIEKTRKRIGYDSRVSFYNTLWEDFEYPENKYTDIVWFRGIEHVKDPSKILIKLKKSLKKEGRLHITFPNSLSLHRKLGFYMGIVDSPYSFSDRDIALGHYHVYDRYKVMSILNKCGFYIIDFRGIMIKFFPNSKMLELIKEDQRYIKALFELGKEYPDLCAEIYICATI